MSVKATGWAHTFPAGQGVRAGREWTRRQLSSLPWAAEAPETVDEIVLAVSELLTNAHVHAHSDAQLVLTWDNSCLHVSVHDEAATMPAPRAPDEDAVSGRGVSIVQSLADSWQTHAQQHGKTVTACFRPQLPERTAHP
ncbi:ATP-binding protein [Streptomyces albidochromogenes]|uniref:ATP-binding protein n=1 Tax=Streptomyces albidochromogenes TaxID=329524 RepID=UPI00142EC344|nr:ATP-binding protein [Streptomyces albidochromogenes]